MSNNVFANDNEISAKKDGNKTICAMPDVCLSPPSPPAGPVPVPYPNTSDASKTSGGSKSVKIGGNEVGLKNKSNYKSSSGDEAATKSFGMGIVSHNIQGPMKHAAWSMDVKIEGSNVIRHMDMTTHNHTNMAQPDINIDQGKVAPPTEDEDCAELEIKAHEVAEKDLEDNDYRSGALVTAKHQVGNNKPRYLKAVLPSDLVGNAEGYCEEPEPAENGGEPFITCTKDRYSTARDGANKKHAEAKILQTLFPKGVSPGGTLTMRINWNKKGTARTEPCKNCKGAICKTAQDCDIKIYLCLGDDPMKKVGAPCKTRKGKRAGTHHWDGQSLRRTLRG
jgi:hypothetical protein